MAIWFHSSTFKEFMCFLLVALFGVVQSCEGAMVIMEGLGI